MESVTDPKLLEKRLFFRLGQFTFDHKKSVVISGLIFCILLASLGAKGPNWAESWGVGDLESVEAFSIRNEVFPEAGQGFVYIVHHDDLHHNDTLWQESVQEALSDFENHESVTVEYSWQVYDENSTTPEINMVFVDDDGSMWTRNVIKIDLDRKDAKVLYTELEDTIKIGDDFEGWKTDGTSIEATFDSKIQEDLITAELISGPLSLIILVLVFGTVVAALLPIGIAVFTVAAAAGVTIWLSHITDVTQYSLNIITLIGIGVSIDYSLFMAYRFREELSRGRDVKTATSMTVATAGKAVFFSGITVAIGLMGMLFFTNTGLPSLGIGGTLSVSIAMVYSLLILPAILATLGERINSIKVPFSFSIENSDGEGIWSKIATFVMSKPWAVLIPTLIILLGAGLPFFQAEYSLGSRDALPPDEEVRIGGEHKDDKWPQLAINAALVIIDFDGTDPLDEQNIRQMYRWMNNYVNNNSNVKAAYGYANPNPAWNETEVVQFWLTPAEMLPNETRNATLSTRDALTNQFISQGITEVTFALNGEITDLTSREFVLQVRNERDDFSEQLVIGNSGKILVAGFAALSQDTQDAIEENLPISLIFIFSATLILIFIQVQSVIIPIKAIIMNILSVSASFGMLVFVFQWGNGAELLNFTPQPIEVTNPVIMFCIVFGLSMDYEVLMLSRIHEEWERTGDNKLAVANGLQRTGRLITGAALIMVVVFSAFGVSSVIILKQIGLGLALAILLDATVVRALVVPSTMRLMGKWNWWSPKWLKFSNDTEDIEESEE